MSSDHEIEIQRLARVLATDASDLRELLDDAAPEDLRALRVAIVDDLLERNRRGFQNAVALAQRLPAPIAAHVAQRVLGPQLAGRMATFLAPATVEQLAPRIDAEFLAGIAQSVDASRLAPLLGSLSTDTVVGATTALRRREDWVTLGAFAEQLPEGSLRSAVGSLDDDALINTARMVTEGERERLLAVLPGNRAATLRLADGHAQA